MWRAARPPPGPSGILRGRGWGGRPVLLQAFVGRLAMRRASYWRDRCGSTSILFALTMPMLIGGLGVGFEVSHWYLVQRAMQNAADAAVLAAASNAGANYDVEGMAVSAQNGFDNGV